MLNLRNDFLPLSTCTLTDTALPIAGEHVYIPASEGRASCTTRKLAVISPFSVMTLTPPRGESYDIICKKVIYIIIFYINEKYLKFVINEFLI